METANVFILYFSTDSRLGNGVAVFNQLKKSKVDETAHLFVKYLTYWVAGTKLIFIMLLLLIIYTGTVTTKFYCVIVMILSIGTYFWKLQPIIKQLDKKGEITPKGYSKILDYMITGFIVMFSAALLAYLII